MPASRRRPSETFAYDLAVPHLPPAAPPRPPGGGRELPPRERRTAGTALWVAGWVVVFAALALATLSMVMRMYDHNESLYLTAGWLVAHGKRLYSDFSFWQMPYSAWSYGAVFWLLHPDHVLLTGKLVCYAFLWISAATFLTLVGRETRRITAGLAVAGLFLLNLTMVRCAGEASNYIQPIGFGLGAFLCGVRALSARRPAAWWCTAGVGAGLSIGFKLYYAPTLAAYGLILILFPRDRVWRVRVVSGLLPFAGGVALSLAPAAWLLLLHPRLSGSTMSPSIISRPNGGGRWQGNIARKAGNSASGCRFTTNCEAGWKWPGRSAIGRRAPAR